MGQMLQLENTLFTIVMVLYFIAMGAYFVLIAAKKETFGKVAVCLQTLGLWDFCFTRPR